MPPGLHDVVLEHNNKILVAKHVIRFILLLRLVNWWPKCQEPPFIKFYFAMQFWYLLRESNVSPEYIDDKI